MPDTRFSLIGKAVVFIVKMPDSRLRKVVSELKQVNKMRKVTKKRKTKKKNGMRKGSPEAKAWGRKMARARARN